MRRTHTILYMHHRFFACTMDDTLQYCIMLFRAADPRHFFSSDILSCDGAKHAIAITFKLSVRLSVCLSVRLSERL